MKLPIWELHPDDPSITRRCRGSKRRHYDIIDATCGSISIALIADYGSVNDEARGSGWLAGTSSDIGCCCGTWVALTCLRTCGRLIATRIESRPREPVSASQSARGNRRVSNPPVVAHLWKQNSLHANAILLLFVFILPVRSTIRSARVKDKMNRELVASACAWWGAVLKRVSFYREKISYFEQRRMEEVSVDNTKDSGYSNTCSNSQSQRRWVRYAFFSRSLRFLVIIFLTGETVLDYVKTAMISLSFDLWIKNGFSKRNKISKFRSQQLIYYIHILFFSSNHQRLKFYRSKQIWK